MDSSDEEVLLFSLKLSPGANQKRTSTAAVDPQHLKVDVAN